MEFKKIIFLFFAISSLQFQSQILDEYPSGQDFYKGGNISFYKDVHEYLISKNFKECGENEIFQPRIIVTKDAEVKMIKDNDTANISANKCAYDLSLNILKNLKNWQPAIVKNNKIGSITEFIIYPKDLMSRYKENYNADNFVLYAKYPKGKAAFDKEFHDNFMTLFADFAIQGNINLEFYVSKEGKITDSRIFPEISDRNFNISFLRTLSRMKKVWQPALYKNIPIKQRISFPMNFSVTYYER